MNERVLSWPRDDGRVTAQERDGPPPENSFINYINLLLRLWEHHLKIFVVLYSVFGEKLYSIAVLAELEI